VHDCSLSRSVGYYLEPLVMLAPFAKKPLHLTLRGVTTNESDLSVSTVHTSFYSSLRPHLQVDLVRTVTLPHLQLFGISDGLELRVSSPVARRPA
jgi:RNA 3'-terminal phosphate cyclase-like protein